MDNSTEICRGFVDVTCDDDDDDASVVKTFMFRRRHQTLSRAVSKIDGFMRLSNVAGFVCHIVNTILLLYSIFFYQGTMKNAASVLTYMFWLWANIDGLIFSTGSGIIVNHMVRMFVY